MVRKDFGMGGLRGLFMVRLELCGDGEKYCRRVTLFSTLLRIPISPADGSSAVHPFEPTNHIHLHLLITNLGLVLSRVLMHISPSGQTTPLLLLRMMAHRTFALTIWTRSDRPC